MLNPFPYLLAFGILAPFVVRTTVGLFFLWSAREHYKRRAALRNEFALRFGSVGLPFLVAVLIAEGAAGVSLLLGAYTQIGAIVAALLALRLLTCRGRLPSMLLVGKFSYALLLIMSATLLLTGAGAFAFDIPL